jgi:RNA polymerase primary sigma factor
LADGEINKVYMRDISRYTPLSSKEEASLAVRIRRGDRVALNRLVKSNLRFVISVARNYKNQGVPLSDLISEGNIGLIRAAHKFDEKKNFRFISYAVWWIRQAILQALARQSRLMKVPLNRVGIIYQVGKVRERLEQRHGRTPETREIAREGKMREDVVLGLTQVAQSHMSLDHPILNDGRHSVMDTLEADESYSPETEIVEDSFKAALEQSLDILGDREREVIRLYFGLGGEPELTLDEAGRRLGITRERVRQLRDRALDRLRNEAVDGLLDAATS